jgi:hypothetical protein
MKDGLAGAVFAVLLAAACGNGASGGTSIALDGVAVTRIISGAQE